ncbi:DUF4173 domain-containing protein [Actinoplanes sp. ATCC 53533]|nr:DUF4173 domain-containing protein [Actinoplanes sp. ATCC 53533]
MGRPVRVREPLARADPAGVAGDHHRAAGRRRGGRAQRSARPGRPRLARHRARGSRGADRGPGRAGPGAVDNDTVNDNPAHDGTGGDGESVNDDPTHDGASGDGESVNDNGTDADGCADGAGAACSVESAGPAKARFFWTGATIVLLGVGTFRAAGWLFFLCLCTAVVTGALAVAGGRSLRAMIIAVLMTPAAGFRSLPWIKRGITAARRGGGGGGKGMRISATVAVSVALLFVFGSLFASADAAFADLVGKAVPDIDGGTVARWIFVFVVAAFALGSSAYLRAAPPDLSGLERPGKRRVARLEWAVPLMLLVLLFALFVAVQLTVLFGGSKHVLDTDGLTYAEYARGGFWQLLIVTGLTLVVLAGAARWAPRETKTDRMLIRGILGSLAVLTLVVVASATHRMDLYADTYGLTRLRLLVVICELWLGLVFLLILVAGIRLTGLWLPRAVVAAAVLALIGLSVANPDRLIADHNVTRFEQTGRIDTAYLSDLSADAVPALDRLTGKDRDCALAPLATDLEENQDDWRGWNLGRYQARDLLVHDPPHDNANCPGYYDLY